jgi:hypothetical protein
MTLYLPIQVFLSIILKSIGGLGNRGFLNLSTGGFVDFSSSQTKIANLPLQV